MPPDLADSTAEEILAVGISDAEAASTRARTAIQRALVRAYREGRPAHEVLREVASILAESEPELAALIETTNIAGYFGGAGDSADKLPDDIRELRDLLHSIRGQPPAPPGRFTSFPGFPQEPPRVEFPKIEEAAKSILERRLVTPEQFRELQRSARSEAFTIAGVQSTETLESVRDVLAEAMHDGLSLQNFRETVAETLEHSGIGPGRIENIYRNNVLTAFANGQDAVANSPIIVDVFPYQAYYAIRDARAREEHLALESLGLSGTNVYRRDDPMWQFFRPPWDFGCRCSAVAMTLEQAAAAGVEEAIRWLETGEPPQRPEHRLEFIPFRPRGDFVGPRARVAA